MNGVLVSRSDFLVAPAIVPSRNGKISRSEVADNRAAYILPLYLGIEKGDKYSLTVDTDGQFYWFTSGEIVSTTEVVTRTLFDALFVGATFASAHYSIKKQSGEMRSHQAIYQVVD
ncbi:hypothetical protein CI807_25550 [Pseudomonas sp. NS1(2017)]|uniref:hypothetical protein n=1 Tax=Pseudomonas sp. NS1(2017) TaxID=2025658 RepID=UPI000BA2AE89|nr:hypothetical protein [Pseudomonas sp. NS1(2017)]ASV39430.1 hypothetical protein CI807_25550 [Pseudomonas sp. NS1(2017)]